MLVIRLARTGKKKQAFFRVVVAEKQRAVGSKFVEILGNYNPHIKKLEINEEKLAEYLKNGAQPSNTLAKLLKKENIKMPKWVNIIERNRPAKKIEEKEEKADTSATKDDTAKPAEANDKSEDKESETPEAEAKEAEKEVKPEAEPAVVAETKPTEEKVDQPDATEKKEEK